MTAAEEFQIFTENWLTDMRNVTATQEEFLAGLRAALEEVEIEIQATKETM